MPDVNNRPLKFIGKPYDPNNETRLVIEPVTGLLQSPRTDRISAELKSKILDIYRQTGNLYDASRSVGVDPRQLRYHREQDEAFNRELDDIHREFVERAKGYMLTHMARPQNYMDRVTIARRFEPGVWGDQVQHTVKHQVELVKNLVEKNERYENQP